VLFLQVNVVHFDQQHELLWAGQANSSCIRSGRYPTFKAAATLVSFQKNID
jgi:hypothetical protein